MKKLLIICGPTATGKTSLGIKLAKKFNGEIISADSRQVYKGMDIGTSKDLPKNSNFQFLISNLRLKNFQIGYYKIKGVRFWLYDIVEPDYPFNVSDWVKCANLVIKDIINRDKLPILVGGTGFYIKSLINGIETLEITPDWKLREKLSNYSTNQLASLLKRINLQRWEKMNASDRKNPRRLIRAIEITSVKNSKKKSLIHYNTLEYCSQSLNVLMIGLRAPFSFLYQRIDSRVEERLKMNAEREVRKLIKKGYNFENSVLGATIGYKEWKKFLEGKRFLSEIIQEWKFAEHAYVRRQMTWFRKEKRIKWFDIQKKRWQDKQSLSFYDKVEKEVLIWYTQKNAKEN